MARTATKVFPSPVPMQMMELRALIGFLSGVGTLGSSGEC